MKSPQRPYSFAAGACRARPVAASDQSSIGRHSRLFRDMYETSAMHSAERVMGALCSALGRVLPIALASLPGTLVLRLDSVARRLQVTALQGGDYLWQYHVRTCPEYAEDLNGQYTAMKRGPKSNASWK
jgi:hypothetical protein